MANDRPSDEILRGVLAQITEGYSLVELEGKKAYVKHFGNEDQYTLERFRNSIYDKARKSGLPTEKETLDLMIEEDIWSAEDEKKYVEVGEKIDSLEETKKNLIIPSQRERIATEISEAQTELYGITVRRQSLLSETCESYAQNKSNDYSIYLSFYKKPNEEEKFFTEEEYSELTKQELAHWFGAYTVATAELCAKNIRHLSINNVFTMYYNVMGSANLYKFFDRPIYHFSFYQLNLLNYAKILHSILENVENIPEGIKNNPDELISFAESKGRNKSTVDKSQDKQGFSVVGATRKDMEEMGVASELDVSPFELAGLNKDGTLTMEDFVALG